MIVINRKNSLLFLVLIFLNPSALADSEYQVKCVPDSVIHDDILGCYIERFKIVDKKLNAIYKEKINSLTKKRKLELQKSQRNWIKKKESLCIVDEVNYGRESHFDAIQCEIDMTNQRIEFLKRYK